MKKVVLVTTLFLLFLPIWSQKMQWEVDFHYSSWSINIFKPVIEEGLQPEFDNYDPAKGAFSFDSNGSNFGFSIRFYPKGRYGSFSIGVSYERNNFKAGITGQYADIDDFGNPYTASADGEFELLPHSFNVNFRWDLWPRARIHPYIGFGLGIGALDGVFKVDIVTITQTSAGDIRATYKEEKTFDDIINEQKDDPDADEFPLSIMPIFHLCVGLRGEVVKHVHLFLESALYNGTILRAGLAIRF
jgi:hypothetical protein